MGFPWVPKSLKLSDLERPNGCCCGSFYTKWQFFVPTVPLQLDRYSRRQSLVFGSVWFMGYNTCCPAVAKLLVHHMSYHIVCCCIFDVTFFYYKCIQTCINVSL